MSGRDTIEVSSMITMSSGSGWSRSWRKWVRSSRPSREWMVLGAVPATSPATPPVPPASSRPATADWTASPIRAAAFPVGAARATDRGRPWPEAIRWAAARSRATV